MDINEQKYIHVTLTLRSEINSSIKFNNPLIPEHSKAACLGIHIDSRLIWKLHIIAKLIQVHRLQTFIVRWCSYRTDFLGIKYRRQKNSVFCLITTTPWYVENFKIHQNLQQKMRSQVTRPSISTNLKHIRNVQNAISLSLVEILDCEESFYLLLGHY